MDVYNDFRDIPQFTKAAGYVIDVFWDDIERMVERYGDHGTGCQIDPEFQRAHVWDEVQQIRYIEFCLRGGKSSRDIYWNCKGWMSTFDGPVYLVDGKQRIEAVRKFLLDELTVFGCHIYSNFGYPGMNANLGFKFHMNDLHTYKEVLQWYVDLNSGGIAHTAKDIAKVKAMIEKA